MRYRACAVFAFCIAVNASYAQPSGEIEVYAVKPSGPKISIRSSIPFSDVRQPATIPNSHDAAFRGLTYVDDDSPAGWCKVFYDNAAKEWRFQTGGGGGDQGCEATCMWIR